MTGDDDVRLFLPSSTRVLEERTDDGQETLLVGLTVKKKVCGFQGIVRHYRLKDRHNNKSEIPRAKRDIIPNPILPGINICTKEFIRFFSYLESP